MIRRQILKSAAMLALLPAAGAVLTWGPQRPRAKRVRPGEPNWPTEADWASLRGQVNGGLLKPEPLLAACESDRASQACADVLKHLGNPYYIGDEAAGTQVSGWFKAWSSATSAYAVRAERAADVVAAVNFARKHHLRLVVKGGGHSYQGTSNAPDSLLVWTRPMHAITLHDAFVPADCAGLQPPRAAVTVEAGAMWMDVYDAVTTKAGRYVQGGGCATVGVAGLVQSGGFGSFSKGFGTAAGSLLEAELVTADGQLRIVNPCKDPDLFWALKGGGGGTFGIVTKLTLRTHDLPEFFGGARGTIQARSDDDFRRLLARFVDCYSESLFNPPWGESVSIGRDNTFKISMVCQGLDEAAARKAWEPFYSWVAASPPVFKVTDELRTGADPARRWWDVQARRRDGSNSVVFDDRASAGPTHAWWSGDQGQVGAFLYGYDSIWLPASLLSGDQRERLADALFESSRQIGFALHFNKGLAGAPPAAIDRARDTATNTEVLGAFALAIVAAGGPSRYPGLPGAKVDDIRAAKDVVAIDRAMESLREIAPSAGSYVSEGNYFNAGWQRAFWGTNGARLMLVKAKYDPDGLFVVHHGIGSEKWSADGFTRVG
jgi:hypothetical protein